MAVAEEQTKVAVPDPVMLLGVIAPQVSPDGVGSVRVTVPLNPFSAVIVMVDVKLVPVLPDGEVADTVKSVTMNVAVVLWLRAPLVPVIVRV